MKLIHIAAMATLGALSPVLAFGTDNKLTGDFIDNISSTACNFQAYPDSKLPKLTKAPKGYEAFHLEHYGRHGSRWLVGPNDYIAPREILLKADAYGKLTPRGKEVLNEVCDIAVGAHLRWGDLTPLGARQHQGIARRMVKNYPTIFKDGTKVDAKSTVVIRCILSMLNELQEMKPMVPGLDITTDASWAEMLYMNNSDTDSAKTAEIAKAQPVLAEFNQRHQGPGDFLAVLFNDPEYARTQVDVVTLGNTLFDMAMNMASHPERESNLADIFSKEDIVNKWATTNAKWFINGGNSSITNGKVPLSQRYLLENILASADTTLTSPTISANLRFGHESVVLPLVVLMEIDDFGKQIDSLDDLATQWHCDEVFPMAANLQLVFYRPTDIKKVKPENVLVKVLLNEREVKLPIATKTAPYYPYTKVAEYYRNKLAQK